MKKTVNIQNNKTVSQIQILNTIRSKLLHPNYAGNNLLHTKSDNHHSVKYKMCQRLFLVTNFDSLFLENDNTFSHTLNGFKNR